MNRQPTAAKIIPDHVVDIYDQNGHYMNRVSVAPDRVSSAIVSNDTLAINLTNGRVKVFALGAGHSPILRYMR